MSFRRFAASLSLVLSLLGQVTIASPATAVVPIESTTVWIADAGTGTVHIRNSADAPGVATIVPVVDPGIMQLGKVQVSVVENNVGFVSAHGQNGEFGVFRVAADIDMNWTATEFIATPILESAYQFNGQAYVAESSSNRVFALQPGARFIAVLMANVNVGSPDAVLIFSIDSLTMVGGAEVTSNATDLAFDSTGQNLYVVSTGQDQSDPAQFNVLQQVSMTVEGQVVDVQAGFEPTSPCGVDNDQVQHFANLRVAVSAYDSRVAVQCGDGPDPWVYDFAAGASTGYLLNALRTAEHLTFAENGDFAALYDDGSFTRIGEGISSYFYSNLHNDADGNPLVSVETAQLGSISGGFYVGAGPHLDFYEGHASNSLLDPSEGYLTLYSSVMPGSSFNSIDVIERQDTHPGAVTNLRHEFLIGSLLWDAPSYTGISSIASYELEFTFIDGSQETHTVLRDGSRVPTSFYYAEAYPNRTFINASVTAINEQGSMSEPTRLTFWTGWGPAIWQSSSLTNDYPSWSIGFGAEAEQIRTGMTVGGYSLLQNGQRVDFVRADGSKVQLPCLVATSEQETANNRFGSYVTCAPFAIDGFEFALRRYVDSNSPWTRIAVDIENISNEIGTIDLEISSDLGYENQAELLFSNQGAPINPQQSSLAGSETNFIVLGQTQSTAPFILNVLDKTHDPEQITLDHSAGTGSMRTRYSIAVPINQQDVISESAALIEWQQNHDGWQNEGFFVDALDRASAVANAAMSRSTESWNSTNPTESLPGTSWLNVPDAIRYIPGLPQKLLNVSLMDAGNDDQTQVAIGITAPGAYFALRETNALSTCGAYVVEGELLGVTDPENGSGVLVIGGQASAVNCLISKVYFAHNGLSEISFAAMVLPTDLSSEPPMVLQDKTVALVNGLLPVNDAWTDLNYDVDLRGAYWDGIDRGIRSAVTPNNSGSFGWGFGNIKVGNNLRLAEEVPCLMPTDTNWGSLPEFSTQVYKTSLQCSNFNPENSESFGPGVEIRVNRTFAGTGWMRTEIEVSAPGEAVVPIWFTGSLGSTDSFDLVYTDKGGLHPRSVTTSDRVIVTGDGGAENRAYVLNAWDRVPATYETVLRDGVPNLAAKWNVRLSGDTVKLVFLTGLIDVPGENITSRTNIEELLIPDFVSSLPQTDTWATSLGLRSLPNLWPHIYQPPTGANAQLSFDAQEAYVRGNFVEFGVNGYGYFGTNSEPPLDFHPLTGGIAEEGNSSEGLGFVSDREKNGWGVGYDDGDFFIPGDPYEGFSVSIGGDEFHNSMYGQAIQASSITAVPSEVSPGAVWTSMPIAGGLDITQTARAPINGQSLNVEITLTNNSSEDMEEIFYSRHVDPDNNVPQDCSFDTLNRIDAQYATDGIAIVSARVDDSCRSDFNPSIESAGSYLGLVSRDPRAFVGFETTGFQARPANAFISGDGEVIVTENGAERFADSGMGMSFDIGTIPAGESTTLEFSYILSPSEIDQVIDDAAQDVESPQISLSAQMIDLRRGVTIGTNPVSILNTGGQISYCTTEGELPVGLYLDSQTCTLEGAPQEIGMTSVVITAHNLGGQSSATLQISVSEEVPVFTVSSTVFNLRKSEAIAYSPYVILPLSGSVPSSYALAPGSPELPAGLTLDPTTGLISGTPEGLSPAAQYSIVGTNIAGSSTPVSFVFSVWDPDATSPVAAINNSDLELQIGQQASVQPVAISNYSGTPIFTITPDLPSGLTFDTNTGVISGRAWSLLDTTLFTVATSVGDYLVNAKFKLTISEPAIVRPLLGLSRNTLAVRVGQQLSDADRFEILNEGGQVVRYTIFPDLPEGLQLDPDTGAISGTLASDNLANTEFLLYGTNVSGTSSVPFTISATAAAPELSLNRSDITLRQGVAIDSESLVVINRGGVVTSYAISPALPAGLTLNTTTGAISGTPVVADPGAGRSYMITANGLVGTSDSVTFTMRVSKSHTAPKFMTKLKVKKVTSISALSSGKQILALTSLTKKICTVTPVKKAGKVVSYGVKGIKAGNCQLQFAFVQSNTWNEIAIKSALIKVTK